MKKALSCVVYIACMLISPYSMAQWSGNVAATSNYLWRGNTQTSNEAAISGGLDYNHQSGFYFGTWASNVDFGDATSYELDGYLGYSGQLEEVSYDLGYIYYAYPDAPGSYDFGELYLGMGIQWFSAKVSYLAHASRDSSIEEDMLYLETNASFELSPGLTLDLHLGYSSGDTVQEWFGEDDNYIDYGASLSKDGFTFGFSNTDLEFNDDLRVYVSYAINIEI